MTTPAPIPGAPAEGAASAAGSGLGAASGRLRDAARWLVVTFGVIAGVVFAGISISRFGDVDLDTAPTYFWVAAAGAALALLGALAALLVSMSLAAASTVSVYDLVPPKSGSHPHRSAQAALRVLGKDPVLAPWGGDTATFFKDLGDAQQDFQQQLRAWCESKSIDPSPARLNRSSRQLEALRAVQDEVLDVASYLRLRNKFSWARWTLGGSLLVAAAGAAAFVWATSPPATEGVPREATAGVWRVPDDDRATVHERLGGASCASDMDRLPVTILDEQGDGKELDVVTSPGSGCRPVRLVVPGTDVSRPPTG